MKIFDPLNIEVLPYPSDNLLLDDRGSRQHTSFDDETRFFDRFREGDLSWFRNCVKNGFQEFSFVLGPLSKSELRQAQYSAVAFITLAIRAAIQGGMNEEDAYSLSDDFIQRIDRCSNPGEIIQYSLSAMERLITTVHSIRKENPDPKKIRICKEFIKKNLHERITLEMLAQAADCSPVYLSSLFRQKTGMTLTDYVMTMRIGEAVKMIRIGKYSSSEIASHLGFSSQSYFIACFKKETGVTPNKFI